MCLPHPRFSRVPIAALTERRSNAKPKLKKRREIARRESERGTNGETKDSSIFCFPRRRNFLSASHKNTSPNAFTRRTHSRNFVFIRCMLSPPLRSCLRLCTDVFFSFVRGGDSSLPSTCLRRRPERRKKQKTLPMELRAARRRPTAKRLRKKKGQRTNA
ncbi:hypothetical protein TGDOM2_397870 [Toxoplasma gondii GAB2-2007-GAL-DOM2]|uniref:Uncharacterized protein n=1 Tax=Toxoplasma gondii GAB2-2007-GAL-DOM2 TaxID=1130820 RepID=A0A086KTK1_TOXGO|nr:hypothetical protein TGDOM2_397870 [Toxoplasma gondii GAB2-2007-GAL-DOM2]